MDRRRDRAARRRRTTLYVESRHRKRSHAPTRAGAWTVSCRRKSACDRACGAVCQRGCHRRVDRPRAPRNLWLPAGEELPGKSVAAAAAAAAVAEARRRSGGGGFREEKKVIGMKHDH